MDAARPADTTAFVATRSIDEVTPTRDARETLGRAPGLRAAIVYDFDGTLARGNIQEHSFLPALGVDKEAFWDAVRADTVRHDADEILVYMRLMLERAREKGVAVTRAALAAHGRSTPLYDGVDTWFERIDAHGRSQGLALSHYVVSSGNREMIEGSPIARHFQHVFASKFIFDDAGHAVWPGTAVNYTTKTQYLFRINKGVDNDWDNERVNRFIPLAERPIPFSRMLYIGDGDTDIPSMKMVRHQGGFSVAVFDPGAWSAGPEAQDKIHRLIAEDRVHFVAPADYSEGSQLTVIVKGILGRFARASGAQST